MPWLPLSSVGFAIATYPFHATQPNDLPLQIGDHIYIIEQNGQWYRGYLVAPPSLLSGLTSTRGQQLEHRVFSGVFPRNCVEVRELLGDNRSDGHAANGRSRSGVRSNGAGGQEEDIRERRKSQKLQARRLSRALSRKRSTHSVRDRSRPQIVDVQHDPMPRNPNVPKPAAPVPLLRVGDETGQSAEEPLVDEIASCLREWHDARLHELLLSRRYSQLGRVQDLIKRLDTSRKQLMHDVMTMKELKKLREDTVWDLVAGNKLLSEEVIVRNPTDKGRILTAEDSVIEMTKQQANMSILDRPPKAPMDMHMLYHILVDVRTLVCDSEQPSTLQVCLYTKEYGEKPRPLTETFSVTTPLPDADSKTSEDQTKSLFVNLNANDLGIGNDTSSLFLVFKLLKDEPVRHRLAMIGQGDAAPAVPISAPSTPQPRNSLRTRRSMFGSQRKQGEARPSTSTSDRPGTGLSGSSTSETSTAQQEARTVKRTVGTGVIDIGSVACEQSELRRSVTMWTPAATYDSRNDEGQDWNDVIRELGRSPTGGFSRVPFIKRFDIFATAFASGDLDALIRTTPTLLYDVHTTQKLGFSGAPTQARSDIYLTLTEPMIPRQAHLSHSKFGNVPLHQRCTTALANLQLTLEVRKANGERVEDCIFTSSNHQGHTAWRTTGIERGEGWNQTIKLAIPAEDVPGSHIVMSIADSPNFPFALSWVPLWENEAFVRDGDHSVVLYVYDEYSSSMIGGKGAYLALPPWHNKADFTQVNAATVSLRTYLCSTEYSQDPSLLGLLNWRNYHGAKLVELLERFAFVPEIEIVKLLEDVFQSLFEILDEYANSEAYEDLIFYNFVIIFGIAHDRRFELKNVVEDYAASRHEWPYASQCLLRAYQRLITSPLDPDSSRKLRAALKVGDSLLKLIIETHRQPSNKSEDGTNGELERHPNFNEDMQKLFVALMALMRNPMPVLLGTQTMVVQHFHTWLPELASIMYPTEIMEVATNLLDACGHAQGRLILHRLVLIVNYSQLDVLKHPDTRSTLIANTYRWLALYWGVTPMVTEQWRSQVRLCCSVVATQLVHLGEDGCQYVPKLVDSYVSLQKSRRRPRRAFSMLFPTSYPFPEKKAPSETTVDEAMLEISALMAAALTSNRKLYFDASVIDVPNILLQALKVGQSVLGCDAFPTSWVSLHVSHHRFAMSALARIQELLVEALPDAAEAFEFDTAIWRQFFDTLFTAVSSPALAMETFPEQKRRAIWKIAGDVREQGAALLKQSWEAIGWETDEDSQKLHGFQRVGGYQVQFVPELVAPIVELCLSMHASLRIVAVEVLRSMIVSAWEIDQDLSIIQTAMIDCLDRLCRSKSVSEAVLQKTFIAEMLTQFKSLRGSEEDELYHAVVEMFHKISELLSMLGNVHTGNNSPNEVSQIVETLRLMEFLRDVQSDDAYIRYAHQLADLHAKAGNHTEAGLALQLHADRYQWDTAASIPEMSEPMMPAQRAFERKEALYFQIIQHFERGQSWQKVLTAYRELATQYETNSFDFAKLARTQRAMASVHERIAKGERSSPRYFRVVYKGYGFPSSLRGKEFIFEGHSKDRLADFEDRIKQLHPAATILRSGVDPEVEGQYLQVFAVSVHKDLGHTIYQRLRVAQTVRDYKLLSNPYVFSTTSRQTVRDVPITDQPVEKVIYTTAESFPTILRRAEVVKVETAMLSPVEAAVERTARKTQELVGLEKRIMNGEDAAMAQLSEALLLSVDPQSESSVSRYRSLLPSAATKDGMSEEFDPDNVDLNDNAEPVLDTLQSALQIALLDHALVIRRCLGLYNRSAHIATRAELVPRFEATFDRELTILFPNQSNVMDFTDMLDSIQDIDGRRSRPAVSRQATEGAAAIDGDGTNDHPGTETGSRRGRRRSLSFLKRGSISSLRGHSSQGSLQINGAPDDSDRAPSRQASRTRSHSRGLSSIFDRRPSQDQAGTPNLKKRLSFLANGQQ